MPQQTMYGAYLYAHTLRSPGISCSPLSCVDALLTLLRYLTLHHALPLPCPCHEKLPHSTAMALSRAAAGTYGLWQQRIAWRVAVVAAGACNMVIFICSLCRGLLTQLAWWQPGRSWRVWRMRSLVGVQKSGDVEMGSDFGHRAAKPL